LRAVDAIDQVRYRDDDLRQDMLDLHGMAHNLIKITARGRPGTNQSANWLSA
jgi:hypothetical protein